MKSKFALLVFLTALLSLLANLTVQGDISTLSGAISFPLGPLAQFIRDLSLQGGMANMAAWLIYLMVSCFPLAVVAMIRRRRAMVIEDALLIFLVPVLFYVLYRLVNPSTGGMRGLLGATALSPMVFSIILGYLVLFLLRRLKQDDPVNLPHYMVRLLQLLVLFYVFSLFGPSLGALQTDWAAVESGNTMPFQGLSPTYGVIALKHLINAIPLIFIILIALAATGLVAALAREDFTRAEVSAKQISRLAKLALLFVVSANIGYHLLQLVIASTLLSTHWTLQLPLDLILLLLGALLFARYVETLRRLQADNDLFV